MFGQNGLSHAMEQRRLVMEGMTAAESCNALGAALAEGRRLGSAAEERERAEERAAKEQRQRAIFGSGVLAVEEGVKNVLVIDGTSYTSEFMSEHLLVLGNETFHAPPPAADRAPIEAAWEGMRHERIGLQGGERADRLELCRRALASGRFHAIIFSDLSEGARQDRTLCTPTPCTFP